MKENMNNINYEVAKKREKETRHDVMSHVFAFGEQCPNAKGIIHLGATSAFVGDNTDVIVYKQALELVKKKLLNLIHNMSRFADKTKEIPTLGYTHYQPAQITTVGKRASLWLYDLLLDFNNLEYIIENLKIRGAKGTTGTQASFLKLFDNDNLKVSKLDKMISEKLGFSKSFKVTGQTYSRKQDFDILYILSSIAQTMHKATNDLRLLQNLKEVEEPFEKNQIGSSAMAYKRNPMRSERISSLCKFVISALQNPALISSTQWFERTLDDSANRRIVMPESFMAIDSILEIGINVFDNLVVNEKVIQQNLKKELPFMATENIMMELVKKGGDRQDIHEKIRSLSIQAGKRVKEEGLDNNLIDLILLDESFDLSEDEIKEILNPIKYIGRSKEQVDELIEDEVNPILEKYKDQIGINIELKV